MHIKNQILNPALRHDNTLHVIGVIQNSARYHSRYRLFRRWAHEMLQTANVKLHVVEAVYGDRLPECNPETATEFELLQTMGYNYHQVKTRSEIWLKENLINLGVKHLLPKDWKYMAWVDCDVLFRSPCWALETLHQLQHYQIVQPWSDAADLTYEGGVHKHFKSFGYFSAKQIPQAPSVHNPYCRPYGHTGFAWACTRYFYENVEKLLDFAILGAGDAHMAWACVGGVQGTINQNMQPGYKHLANLWQEKAQYAAGGVVGYTPGRIEHPHHGPKTRRQYATRWQILVKYKFDPIKDLKYDHQGVLKLKGKKKLEHAIMRYNRNRFEDSIENY